MSGQAQPMQMPSQDYGMQPQGFNQSFGYNQQPSFDSQPRYGQFQNQQPMQPVQPMQQPNFGLLQTFGNNQLGYRQEAPVQQLMQPAPSLLNQQLPGIQQAPMQQPVFTPSEGLQFDKFGRPVQAPPPNGISVGVPGTPTYRFSPMINDLNQDGSPISSPELPFYETGVGRVFPGGIGGGISQPGFSGPTPNPVPIVPRPAPRVEARPAPRVPRAKARPAPRVETRAKR